MITALRMPICRQASSGNVCSDHKHFCFKLLRLELASGMYFLRVLNICIYLTKNVECIYWALLEDDLQAPLLSSMLLAKFPGR